MSRRDPYVQMPANLFRRKGWPILLQAYPRALEWWFHLVLLVRDAHNLDGAITVGGEPLDREDLCWTWSRACTQDEQEEFGEFIQSCLNQGMLREDDDGTLYVERIQDFWQPPAPPSKTREAEQERWHRRQQALRTHSAPTPHPSAETPQRLRRDSAHETETDMEAESEEHACLPTTPRAREAEPWEPARPTAGNGRQAGRLGDLLPDVQQAAEVLGLPVALDPDTPSGHWRVFSTWAGPAESQGYDLADILDALRYGVDATTTTRIRGAPIRDRWRYANKIAGERLQEARDWRLTREQAISRGHPDPGPFRFQPAQEVSH